MKKIPDILQLEKKLETLKNTNIFSETGDEVLQSIAESLTDLSVKKEKIIIRKGEIGNAMYIIVKGKVRVHDGNHVLSKLGAGDVFGEYSLIDEETRSASITAEEPTQLLKLDQKDFYELTSKNLEIKEGVLKVLLKRMRHMNILEEKLSKSYLKIQKQKEEIEKQHLNIKEQKKLLEEQNFDLINLNEEKNHLISVVVHGLRNPLTSSLCMVDLLKAEEQKLCNTHSEYATIIQRSLQRMNDMINQILDVNKIESKKFRLKLEKINLTKLIKQVHKNFEHSIFQKNLIITLNLDNLHAKLNKVYVLQIFDNLISNAIKYSDNGKTIDIKLYEVNNKVRIEIKDEGPGIAKKELNNIFDKYQRQTTTSKPCEQSQGLGLSIVKKYVTAMNGKVWCESEINKGSTFIVEFIKFIENTG